MDTPDSVSNAVLAIVPADDLKTAIKPAPPATKREPNFHVVIWNDNEHSPQYVIDMLVNLFKHPFAKAYDITWKIDHLGKGIACTCHHELAELRRDQILNYGADPHIPDAKPISMLATLEPAPV
jgi:ATP-dependent Clp protease adaptor protein ClpS